MPNLPVCPHCKEILLTVYRHNITMHTFRFKRSSYLEDWMFRDIEYRCGRCNHEIDLSDVFPNNEIDEFSTEDDEQ